MTDINYRTLRGIDGYLAAFPYALQGLEGKRLHNVVEAVHSGVPEGWHPTEEDVAAIAHRKNRARQTEVPPGNCHGDQRRSARGRADPEALPG